MAALIHVILPERSTDTISNALRALTKRLTDLALVQPVGWGFGGEFGYGADYENEVFAMHQFYYGDSCSPGCTYVSVDWEPHVKHAKSCYQTELAQKGRALRVGGLVPGDADYDAVYNALMKKYHLPRHGLAVHCTCAFKRRLEQWRERNCKPHVPSCAIVRPHFRHKRNGIQIRWYKWIGRDMKITNPSGIDVARSIAACNRALARKP